MALALLPTPEWHKHFFLTIASSRTEEDINVVTILNRTHQTHDRPHRRQMCQIWTRLHLPLIPIVLRCSLYEKHAPRNSFIAIDDFETPEDLADYLKYLVGNRAAYMEYFAWRNASPMVLWSTEGFTTVFCNLCRILSVSDDRRRVPVIPNIADWFMTRTQCDYETFDVTVWALKTRSQ